MNRFVFAVLIGATANAFAQSPPAQSDPNPVVLNVNGDAIRNSEYVRRMEYLPGVSRRIGGSTLNFPPGFLALEAMITERLVFQLAKQKGVMPTDPEIQAELATMLTDNPKLLSDAALVGQSKADIDFQVKYNLAQFKLATFGITITDQEVDAFYKNNLATIFTIPKRFKLSVIAVTDEASKSKIDADLAAKKPFAEVAKAYSEDVTKSSGGEFGTVPLSALPEAARKAIGATKIGETTAWIAVLESNVQMKFLLHDVVAEEVIPLDAKARRQIRRQLMVSKGSVKNDVTKELAELRAKSKIDITNKTFAEMYKRFMNEYNEKFPSRSTPPPSA